MTNTAAGQLELGACGATARHPSYGRRTCVLPAGHQPPPGRPPTSTDGWHESADRIRWATHVTATTQKGGTGA